MVPVGQHKTAKEEDIKIKIFCITFSPLQHRFLTSIHTLRERRQGMEEMEGSIYYNLHYSSVSLIEHLNKDVALEVKRFRTLGCNALGEERGGVLLPNYV